MGDGAVGGNEGRGGADDDQRRRRRGRRGRRRDGQRLAHEQRQRRPALDELRRGTPADVAAEKLEERVLAAPVVRRRQVVGEARRGGRCEAEDGGAGAGVGARDTAGGGEGRGGEEPVAGTDELGDGLDDLVERQGLDCRHQRHELLLVRVDDLFVLEIEKVTTIT